MFTQILGTASSADVTAAVSSALTDGTTGAVTFATACIGIAAVWFVLKLGKRGLGKA